jgi:hypothetical protein
VHPLVLLFCIGLFFYLFFIVIEGLEQDKAELEISLFSIFFVLWAQFLLYKKLFLFHGVGVIWQNIPRSLLSGHFASINAVEAIYMVGIIPLIYGTYIIFRYLFKEKRKDIYLLISFALSTGLLLWQRLIEFRVGLMFFGLILALLFSQYFKLFIHYLKQTRVSRFSYLFIVIFVIAFFITSVFPLDDIENIFTSSFEIEVVDLMNKYKADYIYLSPKAMSDFKIVFLSHISSGKCFEKIYGNDAVSVYHKLESCKLKVVG